MISKRKLRFVQISPTLGICEYCKAHFSGSEEGIRQQFQSHKCELQDSDPHAARILGEATEDQ